MRTDRLTGRGPLEAIVAEFDACATAEMRECLEYVLHQRAGSSRTIFDNCEYPRDHDEHGVRADRKTASGEGMLLKDFLQHDSAKEANLTIAHVAALRVYTTQAFAVLNEGMRDRARRKRNEPYAFPVTMYLITDAIKKLRVANGDDDNDNAEGSSQLDLNGADANEARELRSSSFGALGSSSKSAARLWRGVSGKLLPDDFLQKGGIEFAPMSTTQSLETAITYSLKRGRDTEQLLLLQLHPGSFLQHGVDISFLS